MNVTRDNINYIYVLGGVYRKKAIIQPDDILLMYQLNGDCGDEKERYTSRYTAYAMFRMGAINYDNKYIVTFGGSVLKQRVRSEAMDIFVLPLTDNNKGKKVTKEIWCQLCKKLKLKGKSRGRYHFNAVIIDDMIHFVSYAGKYYTIKVESVLNEIDIGDVGDLSSGLIRLQHFTTCGSYATATKSVIIEKMGTKEDDL